MSYQTLTLSETYAKILKEPEDRRPDLVRKLLYSKLETFQAEQWSHYRQAVISFFVRCMCVHMSDGNNTLVDTLFELLEEYSRQYSRDFYQDTGIDDGLENQPQYTPMVILISASLGIEKKISSDYTEKLFRLGDMGFRLIINSGVKKYFPDDYVAFLEL